MADNIHIVEQLDQRQLAQLHALYQTVWWAQGRTQEETQRGVAGSQLCVGLIGDDGELLGFTRVLTDFTYKALLFDVIVDESARGRGLGDVLVTTVRRHPRLQQVKHFELYCLPDMQAFYQRHGFDSALGDIALMRCVAD